MLRRIKQIIRSLALKIIYSPRSEVKINIIQANYNKILQGKKYVITGGSKGIGHAIASKFVNEGADVVII